MTTLGAIAAVLIVAVIGSRAAMILRRERTDRPGAAPGTGQNVLRAEYFSGGAGGGETTEYTVPRDPQAYARLFVPRDRKDKEHEK